MNRYVRHVFILPEDDCDRQIANGFVDHDQVKTPRVQVVDPAGGWAEVLKTFRTEYIATLRQFSLGYLVMLVDFDGVCATRLPDFENAIPADLIDRVFVVGAKITPEALKQALGKTLEQIGRSLADDCYKGTTAVWGHEHLKHNDSHRSRLIQFVKPILFNE